MQILAAGPSESPIEIAVTMRTPGNDAELAVGLLVSEGLINQSSVERVEFDDGKEETGSVVSRLKSLLGLKSKSSRPEPPRRTMAAGFSRG